MYAYRSVATARAVVTSAVLFLLLLPRQAPAQQMDPAMEPEAGHQMQHWMSRLRGWTRETLTYREGCARALARSAILATVHRIMTAGSGKHNSLSLWVLRTI